MEERSVVANPYCIPDAPHAPGGAAERIAMIRVAAYYLAEQRQFVPGHELDDWLSAETSVDAELALRARSG